MAAHTFNPKMGRQRQKISVSRRPAFLCNQTLCQKERKKKKEKKGRREREIETEREKKKKKAERKKKRKKGGKLRCGQECL